MMREVTVKGLSAILVGGILAGCSSPMVQTAGRTSQASAARPAEVGFDSHIAPLLNTYCTSCHSGANAPEGVNLSFANEEEARQRSLTDADFWDRVVRNASSGQMPPPYAGKKPTDAERTVLVDWISSNVLTANGMPDPGPFMVRRLNNREYANTVRDLLYLPAGYDVAADFPADERGDGFDNNAATLTISPLLIEHYLQAAEEATTFALALDPKQRESRDSATAAVQRAASNRLRLPSNGLRLDFGNWQVESLLNLQTFAARAFRRPVTDDEVSQLMKFAALSFAHNGESRDEATGLGMRAALLSPEFLFRIEADPNPDGTNKVFQLTEYQLASRLSYFLWSTMPDDSLFVAARDGQLRANLDAQVARMLQDPKAISLTKDFLGQWLEIRGLEHVPNVPPTLLSAMQEETERFFDHIVRNDRSIMEFLDADYTFVNEELARVYGIGGVTGPEFRQVQVDRARRGGIFTQASFLALTAKPLGSSLRTSPVMRGKWILENIFNETIPPPPPNVPSLNIDQNQELKGTVRQIFEQHRADPVCAGCHARMDPYGFALENYDGYGAWREQDNGVNVDASGTINGKSFTTPTEFRAILADRKDDFRIAVIRKLLSYALGRGIIASDRQTIEQIAAAVEADGDRFSSLILNIVKSYPFQHARAPYASDLTALTEAMPRANQTLYHPVRIGGIPDSLHAPAAAPRQQNQPNCSAQGQGQVGQVVQQAPPVGQAPAQGQQQATNCQQAPGQGNGQAQSQGGQNQGGVPAPNGAAGPAPIQAPAGAAVPNSNQTSNPSPGTVRAAAVDNNREERL